MKTFYGGQIIPEARGDLAVVVTTESSKEYGVFMYEPTSEEFISVTGVRTVYNPVERVYIGVNSEYGDKLINAVRQLGEPLSPETRLDDLDRIVVLEHFRMRS